MPTTPSLTLRIDATGTPFGGTPTYTDASQYVLTTGDAQPVSIAWGRQDENSEPQPSTCSFELDNSDGRFTPGGSAAAAGWDVGALVNIRVTAGGTTYDRFTGYVDSIEPSWPGGGPSWSTVNVSATDVTARLAIGQPLKSIATYEILADQPAFLFPLGEPSSASTPSDISGNNVDGSIVNGKGISTPAAFGGDFHSSDGDTGLTVAGSVLRVKRGVPSTGWMAEFTMLMTSTTASPRQVFEAVVSSSLRGAGDDLGSPYFALYVAAPGGLAPTGCLILSLGDAGSGFAEVDGKTFVADGRPHHIVAGFSADGKTPILYVDGINQGGAASGTVINYSGVDQLQFGGYVNAANGEPFPTSFAGVISRAAFYPSLLSAGRIATHAQAVTGKIVERSDQRYLRLAQYAGLTPTALPIGVAMMGQQITSGQNITEALAKVARTEGTVSYVNGAGQLSFQARTLRYDPTSTLALSGLDVDPTLTVRRDRQGFANEISVSNDGSGSTQRVVDTTSQTAVGRFDGGTFNVAASTDYEARQNAKWQLARRNKIRDRLPNLTVDLLTSATATAQAVLSSGISTFLTLTGLPSQAASSSTQVWVEGGQESIGVDSWSIQFFTSPVTSTQGLTLRADATNTTRNLLDSGLVIPF